MTKVCIIENAAHGVKLSGGRVVNNDKPITLSGRDIFTLFHKKVKVYALVEGEKVRLTPENYMNEIVLPAKVVTEEIEEDLIDEDEDPINTEEEDEEEPINTEEEDGSGETTGDDKVDAPAENDAAESIDEDTSTSEEVAEEVLTEDVAEEVLTEDVAEEVLVEAVDAETVETEEVAEEVLTEDVAEEVLTDAAPEVKVEVVKPATQQYKKRNGK